MASRLDVVRKMLEAGGQAPARVADFMQAAGADAAMAARLTEAAQTGDYRAILREMSEQQWGRTPAVPAPEAPAPTGSRSPMPFEQRIAGDREIRKTIEAAGVPPALRAGVDAGDPEAIMAAYRGAGRRRTEDSIRELAKPADQVAAESIAGQFDRATGSMPPARQMQMPLTDEPTGMVPYGVRGPGVAAGGPSGPGVRVDAGTELIPSPPRRIAGQTRQLSVLEERPYRVIDEVQPKNNRLAKGVGAGLAGAAAAYWAANSGNELDNESAAFSSGGEADLAAQTSPPPAVAATEETPEPTVVQAPQDDSLKARALINRLNDMRRAAGGEVPEAPAMMKEIERLLARGNQTRKATYVAAPQDDAGKMYQQAQGLIDQVNQMYRQGVSPNSPQVQRLMAQVRQLQSQGDAIRNRRAG